MLHVHFYAFLLRLSCTIQSDVVWLRHHCRNLKFKSNGQEPVYKVLMPGVYSLSRQRCVMGRLNKPKQQSYTFLEQSLCALLTSSLFSTPRVRGVGSTQLCVPLTKGLTSHLVRACSVTDTSASCRIPTDGSVYAPKKCLYRISFLLLRNAQVDIELIMYYYSSLSLHKRAL